MTFEGRTILVVHWATWCPYCTAAIPRLNDLHEKYGLKGLQIVATSTEAFPAVRAYADSKGTKYLIGCGGADEYKSTGVPHAWLVSVDRKVVWNGSPTQLKEEMILAQLKRAIASPEAKLPDKLKDAEGPLKDRRYPETLRMLRKLGAMDSSVKQAADAVIEELNAYGDRLLQRAESLAGEGNSADALKLAIDLGRNLPGTEVAAHAAKLQAEWRAEVEADQLVARARELISQKKQPQANALLQQVTKSAKYERTQARKDAQKLLDAGPTDAQPG